jgi:hypothetical protein
MDTNPDQAVYRVRSYRRDGARPKGYRGSREVLDERAGQRVAHCDLVGRAVFSVLAITDGAGHQWQMRPNRRVMPTRWTVTDPQGQTVMELDQKLLGKLANPLYKVALSLLDASGKEIHRLVDPRTSIPDQVMGAGPNEWVLLDGDRPVARLVRLPAERDPPKGLLGRLGSLFASSDEGIVSAGRDHILPAPVALGMLLLLDELTDPSGG